MGFEPTVPAKAQRFSRPSNSTALAPLRKLFLPSMAQRHRLRCAPAQPSVAGRSAARIHVKCIRDFSASPNSTALAPLRNFPCRPWRNVRNFDLCRPGPAQQRCAFPLRSLIPGMPSVACPFGGVNVRRTFTISPPHPWLGAQRREQTLSLCAKAPLRPT